MIKKIIYLIPLFFLFSLTTKNKKFDSYIEKDLPYLKALYIDIHQNPEISLMEKETSIKLANELRKVGFDVEENFGGYGVVGILKNGKGPTIMYRTDMDALPMEEKTDLPYASNVITKNFDGNDVGTMHSCGHDMHMAVWTGTARALVERKDEWSGTIMMIGQPAEEIGAGAAMMLNEGLYDKFPVPDYGIGLHSSPIIPSGKVGFGKGYIMANTESVDIKVFGQGSHGAAPHMSIDPIVTASLIIMELQTIVSRNLNPLDDAVITVGSIKGGTKHNIIPDEVDLQLTIRTYKEEVRNLIHKRIKEICDGIAASMGLDKSRYPKVILPESFTPANYNDEELVDLMTSVSNSIIGKENVVVSEPQMVGEDFARYGSTEEDIPTVMYWLGTVPKERMDKYNLGEYALPALHSPYYYPDIENSISTGVKVSTESLIKLFNN
ncbi:MAG: amidohydrolase [Cytophagales bacterium]|nr:amidohydrolase [Cytophagales bacterium]